MKKEHIFGKTAEKYYNLLRFKFACKVYVHWIDWNNYESVEVTTKYGNFLGEFPTLKKAYDVAKYYYIG